MGTQDIVARILSDANAESNALLKTAEEKARKLAEESAEYANALKKDAEREANERVESILEKRSADARLECAKILLKEKRKTLESVYELALQRLVALGKEDVLRLYSTLLSTYAEEGDEIAFAENFKYEEDVKILPVIAQKCLKFSNERLQIEGGMRLTGKKSDKDLSYRALLAVDKDAHLAELAKTLFGE